MQDGMLDSEVGATVLGALSDLESFRVESMRYFDVLKADMQKSFGALNDRVTTMEIALRAAQMKRVGTDTAEFAALQAASMARMRDSNATGLNCNALLEEMEMENKGLEIKRKAVSDAAATAAAAAAAASGEAAGGQRTPPYAPSSPSAPMGSKTPGVGDSSLGAVDPAPRFACGPSSARHGVINRDERLDLSEGSVTATPIRRQRAAGVDGPTDGSTLANLGTALRGSAPHTPSAADPPARGVPPAQGAARAGVMFVMVEFKRGRTLQFESEFQVTTGEYVMVGGDRGEDIGLVVASWMANTAPPAGAATATPSKSSKNAEMGVGNVVRLATPLEVAQLQGVQAELEARAKEVAQLKVQEHNLPMRIVDAEYQFDRKKLTFFYQSQHRLDFRVLVRDLYKTFRARIWMELE